MSRSNPALPSTPVSNQIVSTVAAVAPRVEQSTNQFLKQIDRKALISFGIGFAIGLTSLIIYHGTESFKYWKRYHNTLTRLQHSANDDQETKQMLATCKSIIDLSKNCMLSTVANVQISSSSTNSNKKPDQEPCSRILQKFYEIPNDLAYFYMASNKKSRKYNQIQQNSNVCVSFWDDKGAGYVALYGTVTEVTDTAKKVLMFPDSLNKFLEGAHDSRFSVLRLNVERIEFCSERFKYYENDAEWKCYSLYRNNDIKSDVAQWKKE